MVQLINTHNTMISVIIPVYGCKSSIKKLYSRLIKTLHYKMKANFEIIFVNDSCPQNSWEVIKDLALKDKRLTSIDLSRNFGQMSAITAGLSYAKGDFFVVMDCDLQDSPEEIERLYKTLHKGYDAVFCERINRKDNVIYKLCSYIFYALYGYLAGCNANANLSNFSISRKIVIDNYLKMGDQNRAFILFIQWMGFKTTTIQVKHFARFEGKSSYNFFSRLKLAARIIASQSNKPLRSTIALGFLMAFNSFLIAIYFIFKYFFYSQSLKGWTSIIISIFFMGGLLLIQIGIVGLYIGFIFNHVKQRPLFIVREIVRKEKIKGKI